MEVSCPICHVVVRPTDYFCYNCGKNLHAKPLSTTVNTQLLLYAGSLLLPPMGIIWMFRYLKQSDPGSKRIGITCAVLTVAASIVSMFYAIRLINSINEQVNSQLQMMQTF